MAVDILFKPRVEATEQMAQNCMDIIFAIQESKKAQNRVRVTWIINVCCRYFLFQLYFTPEYPSQGNFTAESSSAAFFRYRENATIVLLSQVLLFAEFILDIDRKILR